MKTKWCIDFLAICGFGVTIKFEPSISAVEIPMSADVLTIERMQAARRRRFLLRAQRDLSKVLSNLGLMKEHLDDVETSLRRAAWMFRQAKIRHDAYDALVQRCWEAMDTPDLEEMLRLRDAIVHDHATLCRSPFLSLPPPATSTPPLPPLPPIQTP